LLSKYLCAPLHECFWCSIIIHSILHHTFIPRNCYDRDCPLRVGRDRTIFTRVVRVGVTWPVLRTGRNRRCRRAAVVQPRKKSSVGPAGAAGRARRTDDNRSARSIAHGDAGRWAGAPRTPMRKCTATENTAPPPHRWSTSERECFFLTLPYIITHRGRNIISRRFYNILTDENESKFISRILYWVYHLWPIDVLHQQMI